MSYKRVPTPARCYRCIWFLNDQQNQKKFKQNHRFWILHTAVWYYDSSLCLSVRLSVSLHLSLSPPYFHFWCILITFCLLINTYNFIQMQIKIFDAAKRNISSPFLSVWQFFPLFSFDSNFVLPRSHPRPRFSWPVSLVSKHLSILTPSVLKYFVPK